MAKYIFAQKKMSLLQYKFTNRLVGPQIGLRANFLLDLTIKYNMNCQNSLEALGSLGKERLLWSIA